MTDVLAAAGRLLQDAIAPDWVSVFISVLALGVAGYGLYLRWCDRRPSLRIKAAIGVRDTSEYDPTRDTFFNHQNHRAVVATLMNHGTLPVTVTTAALRPLFAAACPVDLSWSLRGSREPTLSGNSSAEVHAIATDFLRDANPLTKLLGVCRLELRDHMGRTWASNYVRITPRSG